MDYARIAAEAKMVHEAAAREAADRKIREEAAGAFFKALEKCLYEEIDKANPELRIHDLLTEDKVNGIVMLPKQFEAQCRMTYGRNIACEVNLDQTRSMIDVELTCEPDGSGETPRYRIAYAIGRSEMGVVAHRLVSEDSDELAGGPYGARQVAEMLVVGIIRSRFD